MTHFGGKPHTNVGDRGQRYEVRSSGYPKTGWSVFGWSNDRDGATRMAESVRLAPSCIATEVLDREQNNAVVERYGRDLSPSKFGKSQ